MIAVITVGNMWAVARHVRGILTNAKFTDAEDLLQIGASVWLVNVIVFALRIRTSTAAGRRRSERQHRCQSGIRLSRVRSPRARRRHPVPAIFVDYLATSFNTATVLEPDRCVGREAVGQTPRHGRIERFPRRGAPRHCPSDQHLPSRRFVTPASLRSGPWGIRAPASLHRRLAEGAGFEPAGCRHPVVFKTTAFVRSATPPGSRLRR